MVRAMTLAEAMEMTRMPRVGGLTVRVRLMRFGTVRLADVTCTT
jgi:hypothetical protein